MTSTIPPAFPVFFVFPPHGGGSARFAAEYLADTADVHARALVNIVSPPSVPADPKDVPEGSVWIFSNWKLLPEQVIKELPEDGLESGAAGEITVYGVPFGKGAAVLCHGSDPVAAARAIFLFGEFLGIRYLLHEDIGPVDAEPFAFHQLHVSLSAPFAARGASPGFGPLIGASCWNAEDYERYVVQLAKHGASLLVLDAFANEPFLPSDARLERYTTARLPNSAYPRFGYRSVSPASLRYGSEHFDDPDFFGSSIARAESPIERFRAAREAWRKAAGTARRFGMKVAVRIHPLDLAPELLDSLPREARGLDGLVPSLDTRFFTDTLSERLRLALAWYSPDYIWVHQPNAPVFASLQPAVRGPLAQALPGGASIPAGLSGPDAAYLQMLFHSQKALEWMGEPAQLVAGGKGMERILRAAGMDLPRKWVLSLEVDPGAAAGQLRILEEITGRRIWLETDAEVFGRMLEPQPRLRAFNELFAAVRDAGGAAGIILRHRRRAECAETFAYAFQAMWGELASPTEFHADMAAARYGPVAGREIARANLVLEGIGDRLADVTGWPSPTADNGIPLPARIIRLVGWGRPMGRKAGERIRLRYKQALDVLERLRPVVQYSGAAVGTRQEGRTGRHLARWRSRVGAMRDIYRTYRQVLKAALILDSGMKRLVRNDDHLAAVRSVRQALDEILKAPVADIQKHLARAVELPEDKAALIAVQCKWIDAVEELVADLNDILGKSASFRASLSAPSSDTTGYGDLGGR